MSAPLLSLVAATLHDPLCSARERAARGARIVGLVGADVPAELVLAAGAVPIALQGSSGTGTVAADQFLEAGFLPSTRAVAEQWLGGALDFIDTAIFSRANDSSQRLYYYLCELQRIGRTHGPRPLLYDLAKIRRASSDAHTAAATAKLADELGSDRAALPEALRRRNHRRKLLAALQARCDSAAPPPGELIARISRAADCCDPDVFDAELESWLGEAAAPWSGPRVLLLGSAPPDERLQLAVAAGGGRVVAECNDFALGRLGAPLPAGADVLAALAHHHHMLEFGPRATRPVAERLTAQLLGSRADAAILWLIDQDEALAWDVPAVQQTMAALNRPLLCLTRRQWGADDGAAAEIIRFVAQLGLKA
jgi:hypothetical protein